MVDLACARMAGFIPERLPLILNAFTPMRWPITEHIPADLEVVPALPLIPLIPSFGWRGWLEAAEPTTPQGDDPYPGAPSEPC